MATMTVTTTSKIETKQHRKVCFSFAAYAKNVIHHLKACEIPVLEGLTDSEFASIESSFNFKFPPDLRSILREGLPVGAGFPNWRCSSPQQLEILIDLPISGICKDISKENFWLESWGSKPNDSVKALALAKQFLRNAPLLVPIYRNCYIPSQPDLAGNPVFFVRGTDIRYSGFDVAGFFQTKEFRPEKSKNGRSDILSPSWAAATPRQIEFWSELVEKCRAGEKRDGRTCGWWEITPQGDRRDTSEKKCGTCGKGSWFERLLEEMGWKLREGGWTEEEVREMTMLAGEGQQKCVGMGPTDVESVTWRVRLLGLALRNAGWCKEDVFYSLGFQDMGK